VLPAGYELVACNVPSQVLTERDGRIAISFLNTYRLKRPRREGPLAGEGAVSRRRGLGTRKGAGRHRASLRGFDSVDASRLSERAHQDREIVYFLQQPDTHAFALYHDYTESRPGIGAYYNVGTRWQPRVEPAARLLDTGESLKVETLKAANSSPRRWTSASRLIRKRRLS